MATLTTDSKIEAQTFANQSYNNTGTLIRGSVGDLEALRQSIQKRLSVQQFTYPVYSFNYGVNWNDLLGQDPGYVRAEMQRMIKETLAFDDRVQSVTDFDFTFDGTKCLCTFTVTSTFGQTREEVEVSV